jgi:sugar O-acyltransferase (sialic acid O-acetyltransferase NeuD family)
MDKLIIVGGGGLGHHIRANLKRFYDKKFSFESFLDKNKKIKSKYNEQNISKKIKKNDLLFINCIGNFAYNWYPKIFSNYKKKGMKFVKLFHDTAIISNKTYIGNGTVVMENALIKSRSKVGEFCLINSSSIISHDVNIGNYCNISLGAKIGGNVRIGNNTFIGMNASVIQGIKIGSNSIIGAGSVVTKNVGDNEIVIGNPIFKYKNNK